MGEYSIQTILTWVGVMLIAFGLLTGNYGSYAVTCVRWLKPFKVLPGQPIKQPKMSSSEQFQCYIPCLHLIKVNNSLGGPKIWNVINVLGLVFILINLFNKFVFAINGVVMLFCSILMFIGIILYWLSYGAVTAYSSYTFGFSGLVTLLCFLFPHLFCWYQKNNIPTKMKLVHKKKVFDEHTDDYVIKDKKRTNKGR